jgi:hypothetical protein
MPGRFFGIMRGEIGGGVDIMVASRLSVERNKLRRIVQVDVLDIL